MDIAKLRGEALEGLLTRMITAGIKACRFHCYIWSQACLRVLCVFDYIKGSISCFLQSWHRDKDVA